MAPSQTTVTTAHGRQGPHPSYIKSAKPFIFDREIRECLTKGGSSANRDNKVRLEGISWIDGVRRALHLPVRTFNTAAVYYHRFCLAHSENIGHLDAAAAALFGACKIEDTLKKSKEILCAAYNMKLSPSERLTTDDPMFEQHSKTIIGLERLMLEASSFDFRNRHPQRLVLKLCNQYQLSQTPIAKTAYNICLDLYRTFAPLKQTSFTMALASVELACRIHDHGLPDDFLDQPSRDRLYYRLQISRKEVLETLFDLLDLYSDNKPSTLVGQGYAVDRFLQVRIALNQEAPAQSLFAHKEAPSSKPSARENTKSKSHASSSRPLANGNKGERSDGSSRISKHRSSPTSPRKNGSGSVLSPTSPASIATNGSKPGLKEGTVRFMLNARKASDEKAFVADYFREEVEEYTVEVPRESERRRR